MIKANAVQRYAKTLKDRICHLQRLLRSLVNDGKSFRPRFVRPVSSKQTRPKKSIIRNLASIRKLTSTPNIKNISWNLKPNMALFEQVRQSIFVH